MKGLVRGTELLANAPAPVGPVVGVSEAAVGLALAPPKGEAAPEPEEKLKGLCVCGCVVCDVEDYACSCVGGGGW